MALQKVLEYVLRNDRFGGPKSHKIVHHCLRSLLEVMVDLKELLESSESDESDSESESEEDDEADESDEVCDLTVLKSFSFFSNCNISLLSYWLTCSSPKLAQHFVLKLINYRVIAVLLKSVPLKLVCFEPA